VIPDFKKTTMIDFVKQHIIPLSTVYTDGLKGFEDLKAAGVRHVARTCGWRIVISPATGHVTLHPFAGLARVVLVVADFKGIRDG
jgi:transposase-like protein